MKSIHIHLSLPLIRLVQRPDNKFKYLRRAQQHLRESKGRITERQRENEAVVPVIMETVVMFAQKGIQIELKVLFTR